VASSLGKQKVPGTIETQKAERKGPPTFWHRETWVAPLGADHIMVSLH